MSAMVRLAVSGGCCDCAAQVDPCTCAAGACAIECRSRSSSATVCGFAEFTNPSSPPKKYLEIQSDGEWVTQEGFLCEGSVSRWTGKCVYSPVTCEVATNSRYHSWTAGNPDHGCVPDEVQQPCLAHLEGTMGVSRTVIQYGTVMLGDVVWKTGSGTLALKVEDTEDMAEERALSGKEWSAVGDCVSSYRVLRGANTFTYSFRVVQLRVQASALVAGVLYRVKVPLGRRPYPSGGPFTEQGQMFVDILGSSEGVDTSDWFPMPIESGAEWIALGCSIEVVQTH